MSALGTVAAIAVTLGGIARLAATDPKRRRSFGLEPYRGRRQVALAMTAVFLPGVLLLVIGSGADFVAWTGAVCVAGWAVAAVSPLRVARAARLTGNALAALRRPAAALLAVLFAGATRMRRAGNGVTAAEDPTLRRIAELEQRVARLEAALAAVAQPRAGARPRRAGRLADFQPQRAADA